jgi:hypothetical protein
MSLSFRRVIAGAAVALGMACAQSSGPSDTDRSPGACVTDLSCPFGQECDGSACAPLGPSLYAHIQTASALFRGYLDPAELQWRAQHYDLVIGMAEADALRAANPHIRIFEYLNTRYLVHPVEASAWASAHGHDPEDFYLHYREDTTVPTWETTVLVPGYPPGVVPGWNPGGGGNPATATSRDQSRIPGFWSGLPEPWYLANVDHAGYRAFLREHAAELIEGTFWSSGFASGPVDGIVCDNAIYYPIFQEGRIDRSAEYYGVAMTDDHPYAIAYETLYPDLAEHLFDEFASTRDVMPNYGHVYFLQYANRSAINVQTTTPWIWGEVWVTYTGQWSPTTGSSRCITYEGDYANAVRKIVEQTRAGGRRILGARDIANGSAGTDRGKLFTLGIYYLLHNAHTYYMYETLSGHAGGAHISAWAWNPAVTFDVGQPDQIPIGATDFQGNASTKEHWLFASGPDPYDPALTYRVLARRFTNALVLVKMLPDGSVTDDRSITAHALDGTYAVLQADGTLGPAVTQATIRNNEALILVE